MEKSRAIDLLDNLIGMIEDNQDNDYDTAFRMAIEALKEQLSKECTTSDMISRTATIDAVNNAFDRETLLTGFVRSIAVRAIRDMPSAQPVATDTNVGDTISRQAAIDVLSLGKEMLSRVLDDMDVVGTDREKYSWGLGLIESYINDIKELPTAQPEPQWISVTERLPDNADHPGAFCPRYQVVTPYGVTEGWYRPHDHEKGGQWFALFWFMSQIYEIWNIDFERGDVPKVIGEAPVMEWRPLPEPYKPNNK